MDGSSQDEGERGSHESGDVAKLDFGQCQFLNVIQKPGNHPNFEKNALGVKRPFSEQLSEFRGILGAILGMALTT